MPTFPGERWNPTVSHPGPCSAYPSLPGEFLDAVTVFPLPLRFQLICTAWAGGQHTALPCLKGEMKWGRLILPMDWDPWEAKVVIHLNCGSMVNAEQLSWIVLENTDFWNFHCSFPLSSLFFFSLFSRFLHLTGGQRDKAVSWLGHCLDHRCHSDAAKGAGWLERWICTDVPAAKAGLGQSSSPAQVYSCDLWWL